MAEVNSGKTFIEVALRFQTLEMANREGRTEPTFLRG